MTGVRAFLDLSGARLPVIQAPMAGFAGAELAIAAIGAGAVGSLACATLAPEAVVAAVATIRAAVRGPINLNVFCHRLAALPDTAAWEAQLAPCYVAEDLPRPTTAPPPRRHCAARSMRRWQRRSKRRGRSS
jgi:nitronate monooxygenase